jgi:hypothetical protein
MSKSKLIIGIILIVVGGGLIPTGFFVNQMFVDQIAEGVPDALLGIEEEALPSLEEQLPVLATPAVLSGLKDEFVAQLPLIINGSGAAMVINQTITGVAVYITLPPAKDQFFNSPTFQADFGTPQGVSDYYDTLMGDFDVVNLGYTVTAQNNLLYGVGPLPGLITDLELGLGVLGYMELYVNVSMGDQVLNATMQFYYNATWTQLEYLAGYISNYLWDVVVKSAYSPPYTIAQYAELVFYSQWANGSVVEDGIDLSLFKDTLPADTKGVEAGVPNPTNITVPICVALWDDSNSFSFVNDGGILIWVGAMQLNVTLQGYLIGAFNLTTAQLTILLGWLGNFMTNLVPLLLFDETGYTVPELAQFAFYEQWADGTIQGMVVLPDGFLAELDPPILGPPYFEVGLTEGSTGLTALQCDALWDETSEYSLVSASGIIKWYQAESSTTTYDDLRTNNGGISTAQMTQILDWLPQFRDEIVNTLAKEELGLPMEPYDLGNALLIGLAAGGGTLAVIGIVLLILAKRK